MSIVVEGLFTTALGLRAPWVVSGWRHLDFCQFEVWSHAKVPRADCDVCGKTSSAEVPWARPGSGFTLLFEALALSLCQTLPVAQAAAQLLVASKRLWRRIGHYVGTARGRDDMTGVRLIGVDETSLKKGYHYVTVVHDLEVRRRLFVTPGRDHETVNAFKRALVVHGGVADANLIAIAYLHMAKLKNLPVNPPCAAVPRDFGFTWHAA